MSETTHLCPECNGKGEVLTLEWVENIAVGHGAMRCANCEGTGWLDEHGEPINLDYVEYLKDECDEQ